MSDLRFEPGNAEQFRAALRNHEPAFLRAARAGLDDFVEDWATAVKSNISGVGIGRNTTGATPAGRLRNPSNALKSSIGGRVTGQETSSLTAILRAGDSADARKYAKVQELGTVGAGGTLPNIKAKSGGWMTIPLPAALTPGGDKAPRAELKKSGAVWRTKGMGFTFIRDHVIFARKSSGSKVVPIYTLRKSVAIPPRLGAHYNFNRLQKKAMQRILDKFVSIAGGAA